MPFHFSFIEIFELLCGYRGSGEFSSKIVSAVLAPVATGINKALKEPKKLDVLADAVADIVPLTTVKRVMKTTLKPQYQQATRSLRPKLEAYGAAAGEKLMEYLKVSLAVPDLFLFFCFSLNDAHNAVCMLPPPPPTPLHFTMYCYYAMNHIQTST